MNSDYDGRENYCRFQGVKVTDYQIQGNGLNQKSETMSATLQQFMDDHAGLFFCKIVAQLQFRQFLPVLWRFYIFTTLSYIFAHTIDYQYVFKKNYYVLISQ